MYLYLVLKVTSTSTDIDLLRSRFMKQVLSTAHVSVYIVTETFMICLLCYVSHKLYLARKENIQSES